LLRGMTWGVSWRIRPLACGLPCTEVVAVCGAIISGRLASMLNLQSCLRFWLTCPFAPASNLHCHGWELELVASSCLTHDVMGSVSCARQGNPDKRVEAAAWRYTLDALRGAEALRRYQGLKAALRMLAAQVCLFWHAIAAHRLGTSMFRIYPSRMLHCIHMVPILHLHSRCPPFHPSRDCTRT
jgi:hypothetical protein